MTRTQSLLTAMTAGIAGAVGGWWLLRRPRPQIDGEMTLRDLLDEVEIIRDHWGIPHIYADTAHDLFLAQGFVHAQDRLWQMDFQRRLAAGRLSEILGPTTLDIDSWMRVLGFHQQAETDFQAVTDEGRRALEAFARGVNHCIGNTPSLPLEFSLLHYEPEPWTPADSLAWVKCLAFFLSWNWDGEIIRARMIDRLGPEQAAWLTGGVSVENLVTVLQAVGDETLGDSALASQAATERFLGARGGSNSWVVDGTWSATGKPLLASDPHLPMQIPGLWYENHLVGSGYNVTGASWPGVPAVLIGHNKRIAWGTTAGMADVQDLYVERFHPNDPQLYRVDDEWVPADVRHEEIRVRGRREPVIQDVVTTRHGPIITGLIPGETQQLALRWSGYDVDGFTVECFLRLNRARNWDDLRDALSQHATPALNVTYADVEGNVGYQFAGKIPLRRAGNGQVPAPGWTDDYAWDGYLAFEELPSRYHPESGYVVTANNKPVGDDYPHYLGDSFRPGFRAQRITELIEGQDKHNRVSFENMQLDQVSIPLQRLAEHLATLQLDDPQLEAAQADVAYWDGTMSPGAIGAALAETTLFHLRRTLFAGALGPPLTDLYLGQGFHSLLHPISSTATQNVEVALDLLDDPASTWLDGRPVNDILRASFRAAVNQLKRELGPNMNKWAWGEINQLNFEHPLGVVQPLAALLNRGPYPAGGDPFTVWPSAGRFHPACDQFHSASYRLIVDLADLSRSVSICPPGQSGHPGSSHYADQISAWQAGRYHPMLWDRDRIERAAEGTLTLRPAPRRVRFGLEEPESPSTLLDALAQAGARFKRRLTRTPDRPTLPPELKYEAPDPEYAYTVFWVKMVREWDAPKRQAIAGAVREALSRTGFEANPTERRYRVAGLPGEYSGLSLQVLANVLEAWDG